MKQVIYQGRFEPIVISTISFQSILAWNWNGSWNVKFPGSFSVFSSLRFWSSFCHGQLSGCLRVTSSPGNWSYNTANVLEGKRLKPPLHLKIFGVEIAFYDAVVYEPRALKSLFSNIIHFQVALSPVWISCVSSCLEVSLLTGYPSDRSLYFSKFWWECKSRAQRRSLIWG